MTTSATVLYTLPELMTEPLLVVAMMKSTILGNTTTIHIQSTLYGKHISFHYGQAKLWNKYQSQRKAYFE